MLPRRHHTYRIKTLMEKHHLKSQDVGIQYHLNPELFYERLCQHFGSNIVLNVENNHGNFFIRIQPSENTLKETQTLSIFQFLKRWNSTDIFMKMISNEEIIHMYKMEKGWCIPLGITFFIKDPANGF
jgi:hypothetical protein